MKCSSCNAQQKCPILANLFEVTDNNKVSLKLFTFHEIHRRFSYALYFIQVDIIRFTLMPLKIHWNIHEKRKMVSYKISKNRKNIIYIHILLTRSKGFQRQLYHRTHWRKNTNKLWAWYGSQYEGIIMMLKKGLNFHSNTCVNNVNVGEHFQSSNFEFTWFWHTILHGNTRTSRKNSQPIHN